ncbi:restriction endonuclease subunit S, partial [Weissella paramesenteroides]
WEKRKLLDGSEKIGDGLHGTPKYFEKGNVYFVNGNNFIDGEIKITKETKHVAETAQSSVDQGLTNNTILMSINGTIGNLAYYHGEKISLGKSAAFITVSDFYKEFIYAYLQTKTVHSYFMNSLTGTTIKNLGLKALRETPLSVPVIFEQKKIGRLFKQIDKLITVNQRKVDLLKELKKGFLQKMFPKNEENYPQIRFAGYTDAWEKRKLGDIGSVAMNKRIFKSETFDYGDVPFYKIGTFGKIADSFITREKFTEYKAKYPFPKNGDVLISASGSIGKTVVYHGEDAYFQDSNIVWLEHDGQIDNKFLEQFYKIVRWSGVEGSTIKRLYNKNILNTSISIPNLDEQEKIGELLYLFDFLITVNQRRVDLLKQEKKALLQKMFV